MARQKTIEISGLNIVTQPHTPESYLKLFELLSSARMPIQVRGDEYLMLLNVRAIMGDEKLNGIEGEVLKFTNIDNAGDWYDILKGTKLKDSEVPKIPANAQPNGVMFHYVFHPKKHIFYFISKSRDSIKNKVESLSPNYMKTLFETGFAHINKSKKLNFDSIEITVLPSNDALNSIIKIPVLKKLEIVVKAPNPDDISTAAAAMLARMNKRNISRIDLTEYSDGTGSIIVDGDTKLMAEIASRNGYVKGVGKDTEGKRVEKSTVEIPMKTAVKVESNLDAELEALREFNE